MEQIKTNHSKTSGALIFLFLIPISNTMPTNNALGCVSVPSCKKSK